MSNIAKCFYPAGSKACRRNMLVFFVGLACTQAPQEPLSLATDFYYEPVIGFSLQSPSFDSLDIRWARPIASIHKSSDWLETRFPDGSRQRCSIKHRHKLDVSRYRTGSSALSGPLSQTALNQCIQKIAASTDGPGSKVLVHSKVLTLIDEHDCRVDSDTLSKLSGTYVAVSGDGEKQWILRSVFRLMGKRYVSARTCLMLRDVETPLNLCAS